MPNSGFLVRDASGGDAPAIAEVHILTWQEAYAGQLPDEFLGRLTESFDRRTEFWRGVAEAPRDREALLVAETDGGIVGFAHVCPSRDPFAEADTGEVTAIYLRQSHWGRGIGRTLFEETTQRLKDLGFRDATLWVLDTNVRTRRFYEAAGWEGDGSEKVDERGELTLSEVRYRVDL
jgi:GNAT superfamily N-acetyltransferase